MSRRWYVNAVLLHVCAQDGRFEVRSYGRPLPKIGAHRNVHPKIIRWSSALKCIVIINDLNMNIVEFDDRPALNHAYYENKIMSNETHIRWSKELISIFVFGLLVVWVWLTGLSTTIWLFRLNLKKKNSDSKSSDDGSDSIRWWMDEWRNNCSNSNMIRIRFRFFINILYIEVK